MLCKECNFDNKDDAVFCEKCGKPIDSQPENAHQDIENAESESKTILLDEVVTSEIVPDNNELDDSEADTTVLTSETINATEIPMGFGMQMQSGTPMQSGVQMQPGAQFQSGVQMQPGAQFQPGAQMQPGAQFQPGAQMQPGTQFQMGTQKTSKEPKPSKTAKEKKTGKLGTGIKVYIALSALAIVGLVGVMIYGYYEYNDKISQLENENNDKQTEIDEYAEQVANNETQISDLDSQVTTLNEEIDVLNDMISNYVTEIGNLEGKQEEYSSYDSLIAFANGSNGQGYSDMFCSDTILHIKSGESVDVKVYYPSSEGKIACAGNDNAIATCELSEEKENGVVATVKVTAVASGNTTITISNDQNDEKINIYVYVD